MKRICYRYDYSHCIFYIIHASVYLDSEDADEEAACDDERKEIVESTSVCDAGASVDVIVYKQVDLDKQKKLKISDLVECHFGLYLYRLEGAIFGCCCCDCVPNFGPS